jgi:hypothetical protein
MHFSKLLKDKKIGDIDFSKRNGGLSTTATFTVPVDVSR